MRTLQTSSASMDAAQWTHQGIGVVKDVEITNTRVLQLQGENKKVRPYKEQALNCPRCNSTNTKFCYYNNYSLSQPRYFCKTCRRYWTEGGSLRNVPVGGGSRKNKKPSFSSSTSSSPASATATILPASSSLNLNPSDLIPIPQIPLQSSKLYDQDLNLAHFGFVPVPESCPGFAAGFGFQELMRQANVKLPLGDNHGRYSGGSMQEGGTGRLLFPFEDLRQIQLNNGGREDAQNAAVQEDQDPSLFW